MIDNLINIISNDIKNSNNEYGEIEYGDLKQILNDDDK